jgi:hypothetical protein
MTLPSSQKKKPRRLRPPGLSTEGAGAGGLVETPSARRVSISESNAQHVAAFPRLGFFHSK